MATLCRGELETVNDPPRLGGVVARDRGLEPFPERLGLAKLAAQPAEEADPGSTPHRLHAHTASLRSTTKPSRS